VPDKTPCPTDMQLQQAVKWIFNRSDLRGRCAAARRRSGRGAGGRRNGSAAGHVTQEAEGPEGNGARGREAE